MPPARWWTSGLLHRDGWPAHGCGDVAGCASDTGDDGRPAADLVVSLRSGRSALRVAPSPLRARGLVGAGLAGDGPGHESHLAGGLPGRMEADDPEAYRCEVLGEFRAGVASFLDPDALAAVVESGVRERASAPGKSYLAFADAASGSGKDSFTLAVAHRDGERAVLDCLRAWRPPFNPSGVIAEACDVLRAYRCAVVSGDQVRAGLRGRRLPARRDHVPPSGAQSLRDVPRDVATRESGAVVAPRSSGATARASRTGAAPRHGGPGQGRSPPGIARRPGERSRRCAGPGRPASWRAVRILPRRRRGAGDGLRISNEVFDRASALDPAASTHSPRLRGSWRGPVGQRPRRSRSASGRLSRRVAGLSIVDGRLARDVLPEVIGRAAGCACGTEP